MAAQLLNIKEKWLASFVDLLQSCRSVAGLIVLVLTKNIYHSIDSVPSYHSMLRLGCFGCV